MIENNWHKRIFSTQVVSSSISAAPILVFLLPQLEQLIDELLLGNIDSIYLNAVDYVGYTKLEVGSIKSSIGIEIFNYNSIGDRYANKQFLYLYLGDLLEELTLMIGHLNDNTD